MHESSQAFAMGQCETFGSASITCSWLQGFLGCDIVVIRDDEDRSKASLFAWLSPQDFEFLLTAAGAHLQPSRCLLRKASPTRLTRSGTASAALWTSTASRSRGTKAPCGGRRV